MRYNHQETLSLSANFRCDWLSSNRRARSSRIRIHRIIRCSDCGRPVVPGEDKCREHLP